MIDQDERVSLRHIPAEAGWTRELLGRDVRKVRIVVE